MTLIENHFIKPLVEFYGRKPFGDGFYRRLRPYADGLSAEHLELVATRMIETRKSRTFPTFGECKAALGNANDVIGAPSNTAARPWDYQRLEEEDYRARMTAVRLCRCDLGRQADGEGWLIALIDFCRDHGRLPEGAEIVGCKTKARKSEDGLERTRGGPFFASLVKLRKNMLERAHKDVFGSESAPLCGPS